MFAVFPFHHETSLALNATLDAVFAYLDDFKKLSSHMEKSSGMMLGSSMTIETDDQHGRAVGSTVRMRGKVLGIPLSLDEAVVVRDPPYHKAWQTVDCNLLVIDSYRLGSPSLAIERALWPRFTSTTRCPTSALADAWAYFLETRMLAGARGEWP